MRICICSRIFVAVLPRCKNMASHLIWLYSASYLKGLLILSGVSISGWCQVVLTFCFALFASVAANPAGLLPDQPNRRLM